MASFTLENLESYIAVLERAKLGPSGILKHLGGLATFAAHLSGVDPSFVITAFLVEIYFTTVCM